jgi:ribonuclease P protein component
VLPAGSRLRTRADFASTLRRSRGARAAGLLVVHLTLPEPGAVAGEQTRAGLAVPRSVGPAVTRNLVKRRLRHLLAARLGSLPAGTRVVVRALPPSAAAGYADLGAALDRGLEAALTRSRAGQAGS